jgi:hypothetical protein
MEKGNGAAQVASVVGGMARESSVVETVTSTVVTSATAVGDVVKAKTIEAVADAAIAEGREMIRKDRPGDGDTTPPVA